MKPYRVATLALRVVFTLPVRAGAAPILFEGFGADAPAIQSVVDAFRGALGSPNDGNAPGPLANGRREINWDGGGLATTISPTPSDGFQNNRGALFTTSGTGFVQAPPSGLASAFNSTYAGFDVFSSARRFSPIGSTLTNVTFSIPGTNGGTPATVTGFGAVFSDVDSTANASVSLVNASGIPLGTFSVPAANDGLSFLGLLFPGEAISQVQIISGNVPLGPAESGAIDNHRDGRLPLQRTRRRSGARHPFPLWHHRGGGRPGLAPVEIETRTVSRT